MICLVTSTAYEAEYLLTQIKKKETVVEGQITLYVCEYEGISFLLLLTGYGRLNAGLGIGYAMAKYEITTLIGFGDCAALDTTKECIGMVVLLSTMLEYDVDFSPLGYPETVIPGMDRGTYTSNQRLLGKAQRICKEAAISFCHGSIASTDKFIANQGMAERIGRSFRVDYVDNESGAYGQAASSLGIPFLVIKGVSNYADGNAVTEYESYSKMANQLSCWTVHQLLVELLGSK